jgi:hypothetical protein
MHAKMRSGLQKEMSFLETGGIIIPAGKSHKKYTFVSISHYRVSIHLQ